MPSELGGQFVSSWLVTYRTLSLLSSLVVWLAPFSTRSSLTRTARSLVRWSASSRAPLDTLSVALAPILVSEWVTRSCSESEAANLGELVGMVRARWPLSVLGLVRLPAAHSERLVKHLVPAAVGIRAAVARSQTWSAASGAIRRWLGGAGNATQDIASSRGSDRPCWPGLGLSSGSAWLRVPFWLLGRPVTAPYGASGRRLSVSDPVWGHLSAGAPAVRRLFGLLHAERSVGTVQALRVAQQVSQPIRLPAAALHRLGATVDAVGGVGVGCGSGTTVDGAWVLSVLSARADPLPAVEGQIRLLTGELTDLRVRGRTFWFLDAVLATLQGVCARYGCPLPGSEPADLRLPTDRMARLLGAALSLAADATRLTRYPSIICGRVWQRLLALAPCSAASVLGALLSHGLKVDPADRGDVALTPLSAVLLGLSVLPVTAPPVTRLAALNLLGVPAGNLASAAASVASAVPDPVSTRIVFMEPVRGRGTALAGPGRLEACALAEAGHRRRVVRALRRLIRGLFDAMVPIHLQRPSPLVQHAVLSCCTVLLLVAPERVPRAGPPGAGRAGATLQGPSVWQLAPPLWTALLQHAHRLSAASARRSRPHDTRVARHLYAHANNLLYLGSLSGGPAPLGPESSSALDGAASAVARATAFALRAHGLRPSIPALLASRVAALPDTAALSIQQMGPTSVFMRSAALEVMGPLTSGVVGASHVLPRFVTRPVVAGGPHPRAPSARSAPTPAGQGRSPESTELQWFWVAYAAALGTQGALAAQMRQLWPTWPTQHRKPSPASRKRRGDDGRGEGARAAFPVPTHEHHACLSIYGPGLFCALRADPEQACRGLQAWLAWLGPADTLPLRADGERTALSHVLQLILIAIRALRVGPAALDHPPVRDSSARAAFAELGPDLVAWSRAAAANLAVPSWAAYLGAQVECETLATAAALRSPETQPRMVSPQTLLYELSEALQPHSGSNSGPETEPGVETGAEGVRSARVLRAALRVHSLAVAVASSAPSGSGRAASTAAAETYSTIVAAARPYFDRAAASSERASVLTATVRVLLDAAAATLGPAFWRDLGVIPQWFRALVGVVVSVVPPRPGSAPLLVNLRSVGGSQLHPPLRLLFAQHAHAWLTDAGAADVTRAGCGWTAAFGSSLAWLFGAATDTSHDALAVAASRALGAGLFLAQSHRLWSAWTQHALDRVAAWDIPADPNAVDWESGRAGGDEGPTPSLRATALAASRALTALCPSDTSLLRGAAGDSQVALIEWRNAQWVAFRAHQALASRTASRGRPWHLDLSAGPLCLDVLTPAVSREPASGSDADADVPDPWAAAATRIFDFVARAWRLYRLADATATAKLSASAQRTVALVKMSARLALNSCSKLFRVLWWASPRRQSPKHGVASGRPDRSASWVQGWIEAVETVCGLGHGSEPGADAVPALRNQLAILSVLCPSGLLSGTLGTRPGPALPRHSPLLPYALMWPRPWQIDLGHETGSTRPLRALLQALHRVRSAALVGPEQVASEALAILGLAALHSLPSGLLLAQARARPLLTPWIQWITAASAGPVAASQRSPATLTASPTPLSPDLAGFWGVASTADAASTQVSASSQNGWTRWTDQIVGRFDASPPRALRPLMFFLGCWGTLTALFEPPAASLPGPWRPWIRWLRSQLADCPARPQRSQPKLPSTPLSSTARPSRVASDASRRARLVAGIVAGLGTVGQGAPNPQLQRVQRRWAAWLAHPLLLYLAERVPADTIQPVYQLFAFDTLLHRALPPSEDPCAEFRAGPAPSHLPWLSELPPPWASSNSGSDSDAAPSLGPLPSRSSNAALRRRLAPLPLRPLLHTDLQTPHQYGVEVLGSLDRSGWWAPVPPHSVVVRVFQTLTGTLLELLRQPGDAASAMALAQLAQARWEAMATSARPSTSLIYRAALTVSFAVTASSLGVVQALGDPARARLIPTVWRTRDSDSNSFWLAAARRCLLGIADGFQHGTARAPAALVFFALLTRVLAGWQAAAWAGPGLDTAAWDALLGADNLPALAELLGPTDEWTASTASASPQIAVVLLALAHAAHILDGSWALGAGPRWRALFDLWESVMGTILQATADLAGGTTTARLDLAWPMAATLLRAAQHSIQRKLLSRWHHALVEVIPSASLFDPATLFPQPAQDDSSGQTDWLDGSDPGAHTAIAGLALWLSITPETFAPWQGSVLATLLLLRDRLNSGSPPAELDPCAPTLLYMINHAVQYVCRQHPAVVANIPNTWSAKAIEQIRDTLHQQPYLL